MKCVICKNGNLKPGRTAFTLLRENVVIVVKNVPAEICDNCGEPYFSEEITRRVLKLAEDAAKRGTEVEIIRFAA